MDGDEMANGQTIRDLRSELARIRRGAPCVQYRTTPEYAAAGARR
jgi:hypothetical protein